MTDCGFNTTLLHGVDEKYSHGATQVPIYQSSAFRHERSEEHTSNSSHIEESRMPSSA